MKECPRTYHLVYIIKRESPFKTPFNRILSEFFEAGNNLGLKFYDLIKLLIEFYLGLFNKWYSHLEIALVAEMSKQRIIAETTDQALSLSEMQTAFYFLFIGLGMSLFAFVVEIMYFRYNLAQIYELEHWVYVH